MNPPHQPLKKLPSAHPKPAFNQLYIKGSRPLQVYIKHANKVLTKHNVIIIHAMTAAINRAVKLALYLMEEYPYLMQEIWTDSVPTLAVRVGQKGKQCGDGEGEGEGKGEMGEEQHEEGGEQIVKERSAIHIVLSKTLKKEG